MRYAETSVYKLPATVTPEEGTLLSDILPTGHEIGIQYGNVKAGDVVAVVGAGPVGLAAIATAGLYGAEIGSSRSTWMPTGLIRRRNSAQPTGW